MAKRCSRRSNAMPRRSTCMTADALAALIVATVKRAVDPLRAAIDRLTVQVDRRDAAGLADVDRLDATIGGVRDRLAALETRAAVPGPAGRDGADGKDGRDGLNGADGVGFDDLAMTFDGDRTVTLIFKKGATVKTFPVTLAIPRYQGVFTEGTLYGCGDLVTYAGSTWHCQTPTTATPGDGSPAWRLMVKRGRDGKDGRDLAP